MATITPHSPSPQANPGTVESINPLFDDPEADVVLRSRDSHTFRVLKLYIIRSSTVLGDLIRAASNSSDIGTGNVSRSEERLPEVRLRDSSTILSSLLTFVFPVPPILPSTLEETMELHSVAQKYEMNSVLTHIRGVLALQDPPFIRPDNAFLAYSLAQKYGLRKEVTQAARLTLKFTFTIESLEPGVVPGSYLHELWKYHKAFRALLSSDLSVFRIASLNNALHSLNCSQSAWVNTYVQSIITSPSLFDPIEFQMALVRHTTDTVGGEGGCSSCANIPVDRIRTFWTALSTAVHRCMIQAESELPVLVTEMNSQSHLGSPATPLPLPECLDTSEADIIVRTSDLSSFPVHKLVLASSSTVFRDMFTLPNPPGSGLVNLNGLPVVDISEDAELVRSLVTILYHIPSEIPASYDRILALLAAAQKYDMEAVQSSLRAAVARGPSPTVEAFHAFAIASSSRLTPEMDVAARLTLHQPMTFEHLGNELRLFEGQGLRELVRFREKCRDNLASCFKSFLDIDSGPSKIWVGCSGHNTRQPETEANNIYRRRMQRRMASSGGSTGNEEPNEAAPTTLPPWLHDIFTREIADLAQAFKRPLIKPSRIREKYLEALQRHVSPDLCDFCVRVHITKGEGYCVRLEQELASALAKASVIQAAS